MAEAGLVGLVVGLVLIAPVRAQDDGVYAPPAPVTATPLQGDDQGQVAPPGPDQGPAPENGGAPDGSASFQTFYDSLASQGTWIQTDDYGYVWQPQENDPNWAPYTDGHWVYTDDGWTWDSDESFGWATYHYGRWANIDGTGWVWVPGYTWAPAWVSWRYGDGYVGWAPLPPDSFAGIDYFGDGFDDDFGFHIGGDCDDFYGIGPALYIFLPINCVGYHDYHHWYRNRGDNFGLINHTTNVTNINVTRGGAAGAMAGGTASRHVTTGGPKVAQINAASQMPVPRVSLVRSTTPGGGTLTANSLALYAPRIAPASVNARPARVAGTIGAAEINRGTDITRPPMVNARLAPEPATEAQVEAAREAQGRAPASAKVMTDASAVKPIFQGPLTALKPATQAPVSTRAYNFTPAPVYGSAAVHSVYGPVHVPATTAGGGETPSEREVRETQEAAPSRVYNPAPVYTPRESPGGYGSATESRSYTPRESSSGGYGGAPESHPYNREAPSYSPPASRSAPSGGSYEGGGRGSSGGGGGSAASGNGSGRSH
jgi:hypothetical protein